jgi:PKD repeat protein
MQRAGGLFVYMDARKLSEIQTNYKLLGGARWIGKGTMDRFLSATVYWPTAYMLLKTAGEYIEAKTPIGVPGISDEEAKKHIAGGGEDITNLFRVAGQNWWKGFLFSGDHFTKLTGQSPLLAAVFENVYGLDKPSENDPKKKTKAEELKERVRQEWVRDSTAAKQKLDSIKAEGQRQIQYLDSLKKALNPTYIDTMVKNVEKVEY